MEGNNEDLELEEQLAKLGVDLGNGAKVEAPKQVQQVVQPVQNSIPQPFTPENPTNVGVVTNSVTPVQQTIQEQANQQAQAQVVATTTTVGNPVQVSNNAVVPPVQPVQFKAVSAPTKPTNEPIFIDLARAVNTQKTPWLRLKDNEYSRVLFLDLHKIIPLKLHYLKGLGWFQCLSSYTPEGWLEQPAICCKKFGPNGEIIPRLDENGNELKAKNRYLIPVIEYPNDKSSANKLIPGQLPQLKMWNMNAVEWGDLRERVQVIAEDPDDLSTADMTGVDFILHKDTGGKYKTISVNMAPKCLRDSYADSINAEIAKATPEFYSTALKEARKIISEETINNAYATQEAVDAAVDQMMNNETYGNQQLNI